MAASATGSAHPRVPRHHHELLGALELATAGVDALTARIGEAHEAIADRVFGLLGAPAAPVRLAHDAISTTAYASVRAGAKAVGAWGGPVLQRLAGSFERPSLTSGRRRSSVVAAVNGAFGDFVARTGNPLDLGMALRVDGRDVALTTEALAAAYPEATGAVVLFVHGLCEDDGSWSFGTGERSYARLLLEHGLTATYLRYNTGVRVPVNGAALDALLDGLVAAWPVPLTRLVLVGHSMGGLLARSACAQGSDRGAAWVPLVRQCAYLGTPHLGAPLEQVTERAVRLLGRLPETRPIAVGLTARAAGVKDLRHGSLLAGDTPDREPEDVPLLATATHHAIGATLTRDSGHRVARALGDLLVVPTSAHGNDPRATRTPLALTDAALLPGRHHFHLLNDPAVGAHLAGWLGAT